jgi:L-threonylcarbamoyladenylate synthase
LAVTVVLVTPQAIQNAARILLRGGLVAFPTETVYGLGANAFSPDACAKVFAVKRRPRFDPLIVHVGDESGLAAVCDFGDARARRLAEAFWPGPLTLVVPKAPAIPDIVTAGLPTVAVRVPGHPAARALLAAAGIPIAAPSANPFGYISPTLASHVERQIGAQIDLVLDGGACTLGVESTIVDLSGERPVLLRSGAIEAERIEAVVGGLARAVKTDSPRAPGQLDSHYAPRTRLMLVERGAEEPLDDERSGLLAFGEPAPGRRARYAAVEVLSPKRDLHEAAVNLFACMHRLDEASLTLIHAERLPEEGLGVAIMDRLGRAASAR